MRRIFLVISVFLGIRVSAQQEPLFTQYYVNDMAINPAISGSKTYNPFIIQTRRELQGFEGAPLSSNISYHGALNDRSAMGGYLLFDQKYPEVQADLHLNYAYHVPLNYDKVNLSFGLGAKLRYYNLDFNTGDLPPGEDGAFSANAYDKTLADASSGAYLYGQNFYAGFSVSNMFQSSFNTPVKASPYSNSESRIYYGMGAYRYNIMNNDWQFEPSFLIKKIQFQRGITDLTTRIIYLEDNWAGLTYRTNRTAVFAFGFGSGNMHFSYSYDYFFADEIMQYTFGTHEIGVAFRIETMATKRHIGFWGY